MKRLDENQKITLTIGQLRQLIKEARNRVEVSNFKRDSLACSFTGRFGSMRKPQDWVIYPKSGTSDKKVYIQCDNRWGEIDVDSGILLMSAAHGFSNNMTLMIDKAKGKAEEIKLDRDIVDKILELRDAKPESMRLFVGDDDENEDEHGKGPWSDPDYLDYVR